MSSSSLPMIVTDYQDANALTDDELRQCLRVARFRSGRLSKEMVLDKVIRTDLIVYTAYSTLERYETYAHRKARASNKSKTFPDTDMFASGKDSRLLSQESMPCYNCRAAGRVQCPKCGGSGKHQAVSADRSYITTSTCSKCSGRGNIKCPECRGTGKLWDITTEVRIRKVVQLSHTLPNQDPVAEYVSLTQRDILDRELKEIGPYWAERYPMGIPAPELPSMINDLYVLTLERHGTEYPDFKNAVAQAHEIRRIPVVQVDATWSKGEDNIKKFRFWVCGPPSL